VSFATSGVRSKSGGVVRSRYLPGGSHCGGSSEPAWVASSWVSTPPTQSYLQHPGVTTDTSEGGEEGRGGREREREFPPQ